LESGYNTCGLLQGLGPHGLHCNGPSQGDGEVCEKCKNAIVLGGFIGLDEKKTMMVVD